MLVVEDDFGVQGHSENQPERMDAESVAGHLLKADSAFVFLAAHLAELFSGRDVRDRPNRFFEAVKQVVGQTGALAGKALRALDSTVLDDAVATQDTVTQLIGAIRRVGRAAPGATA